MVAWYLPAKGFEILSDVSVTWSAVSSNPEGDCYLGRLTEQSELLETFG